jgi:hypothetical protein
VTNKIKPRHPFRVSSGDYKGMLPHEMPEDDFLCWLIEQGMTKEDYQITIDSIAEYLEKISVYGFPVRTEKLTDDQAGWARTDFKLHYDNPLSKWFINPDKQSRPIPATYRLHRSRGIREDCDCAEDGIQEYVEWGTFHDGRTLYQCEACGEVIVARKEVRDGRLFAA